jgi:hypothetical protein
MLVPFVLQPKVPNYIEAEAESYEQRNRYRTRRFFPGRKTPVEQ